VYSDASPLLASYLPTATNRVQVKVPARLADDGRPGWWGSRRTRERVRRRNLIAKLAMKLAAHSERTAKPLYASCTALGDLLHQSQKTRVRRSETPLLPPRVWGRLGGANPQPAYVNFRNGDASVPPSRSGHSVVARPIGLDLTARAGPNDAGRAGRQLRRFGYTSLHKSQAAQQIGLYQVQHPQAVSQSHSKLTPASASPGAAAIDRRLGR
jgi:hypothetical protein